MALTASKPFKRYNLKGYEVFTHKFICITCSFLGNGSYLIFALFQGI